MRNLTVRTPVNRNINLNTVNNPLNSNQNNIPGHAMGLNNMDDVHAWNNQSLRRQGFNQNIVIGNNTVILNLQGKGSLFVGILVRYVSAAANFDSFATLNINEFIPIQKVPWSDLSNDPTVSNYNGMYYPVNTPLNGGNDNIQLDFFATTIAGAIYVTCYYV